MPPFPLLLVFAVFSFCVQLKADVTEEKVKELFTSISSNDLTEVQSIIDGESDSQLINAQGRGGQTPLMFAVLSGSNTDIVSYLLKANADTSIGEKDGYTAMHGAGFQGRADILKVLIDFGLDPRDTHSDGYEGMHRACWGSEPRHTDTVLVFLNRGNVPFDAKSRDGKTCLEMTRNSATKRLLENLETKADL